MPLDPILNANWLRPGQAKQVSAAPRIFLRHWDGKLKGGSVVPVMLTDRQTLDVMRLFALRKNHDSEIHKSDLQWVFMYWFIGDNSTTPYFLQTQKIDLGILLGTSKKKWAFILVGTPVLSDQDADGMAVEKAEKALSNFIASLYPALTDKS